jgi:hypothetical protein
MYQVQWNWFCQPIIRLNLILSIIPHPKGNHNTNVVPFPTELLKSIVLERIISEKR